MLMTLLAHQTNNDGWNHVDTFIVIGMVMVALMIAMMIAMMLLLIRGWRMATAVVESLAGLHAALRNHLIYHVAETATQEDEGL
jgi:hypothetical protein